MAIQGGVIETKTIGLSIGTTGTFVNTELVNGQIQLKKKDGTNFLHEEGEWISPVIDIGDNFQAFGKVFTTHVNSGSSSIAILTRTSDDGINFDAWTATAVDGAILSVKRRYISIKVVFYAAFGDSNIIISQLDNQTEALKFFNSEWIDTSSGLKLRRNYEFGMSKSSTWSDTGTLHKKIMTRSDWAKISTLNVKKNSTFSNKTLISNNGEYKKWMLKSPPVTATPANTNLVGTLTSSTSNPNLKLFSSTIYASGYEAFKAFNGVNGAGTNSALLTGTSGFIGVIFNDSKPLGKYKIGFADIQANNAVPKDWKLLGSNNTTDGVNGDWVVIDIVTNQSWASGQTGMRTFDIEGRYGLIAFKAYKIIHTSNQGFISYTAFSEIELISPSYDVPSSIGNPSQWSTVSPTPSTSTQFIEQGMDSLSPLIDRKLSMLEPQVMTQDTTWAEGGKVFKKSIDLKKYFDIRSINITN